MKEEKKFLHVALPIAVGLISFFVISELSITSHWTLRYIAMIDTSRQTTLKLLASSAASSAAITTLPGDIASPIATELAQLSKAFMVVLCALYLEKFDLVLASPVVFKALIPLSCGFYSVGSLLKKDFLKSIAGRILAFAVAFLLLVPVSLSLSASIEDSYQEILNETIESAEDSSKWIQDNVDEDEGESGILSKIANGLKSVGGAIAGTVSDVTGYFEKLLSRFIESVAIMIVVTCLIPISVIWLFSIIVKGLFNFNISNPKHLAKVNKIGKLEEPIENYIKDDYK